MGFIPFVGRGEAGEEGGRLLGAKAADIDEWNEDVCIIIPTSTPHNTIIHLYTTTKTLTIVQTGEGRTLKSPIHIIQWSIGQG